MVGGINVGKQRKFLFIHWSGCSRALIPNFLSNLDMADNSVIS